MTVTSGFFDSVSSDRLYSAAQMGAMFNGLITDGILSEYEDALAPVANSTMFVTIGMGRAWFMETWTYNDADASMQIADSEPALDRIDTIVLEINKSVSTRDNTIFVIEGTPASSPVPPTLVDTAEIKQYPLVDVYVAAAVTTIETVDLTDRRGTVDTPYVSHLWVPIATTGIQGIVELATTAEVDAGTDTERAITPVALENSALVTALDALIAGATMNADGDISGNAWVLDEDAMGSNSSIKVPTQQSVKAYVDEMKKVVAIAPFDSATSVEVGNGVIGIPITSDFNGYNITNITAYVHTKGITGTTSIQIRRRRAGSDVDVLSVKITLGNEYYASDETINTSNDDLVTGDMLYVDIDTTHSGTAPLGLTVAITINKP